MLSDTETELITAAVDGELTPAQAADLQRLLADNAEASTLYRQMQKHQARLKAMARHPAPVAVRARVLAHVEATPIIVPNVARPYRSSPTWLPQALAASLLLTVVAGTCWFFLRDNRPADNLAQQQRLPHPVEAASTKPTYTVPGPRGVESIPAPRNASEVPDPRVKTPVEVAIEPAPTPRTVGVGDVVASPSLTEPQSFESVQLRLPFLVPLSDLDQPESRKKLLAELARDPAFRLDLFTRDPHRAAELFRASALAAKVNVTVDTVAQDRMNKKIPSAWVVYTETLSSADIAALLGQLAKGNKADKSAAFSAAHLIPAQQNEQREVRDLLGVDPGLWKRPLPPTEPKPISATTADQVAANLLKSNGEKTALMLTYLPLNGRANPALSKEVKAFLDRRSPRPANAVPLIVVIRPAV